MRLHHMKAMPVLGCPLAMMFFSDWPRCRIGNESSESTGKVERRQDYHHCFTPTLDGCRRGYDLCSLQRRNR